MSIEQLTNDLKEVYFIEANPANWTAAGVHPTELSQQEKAARSLDKKDAALTAGLLVKTMQIAELMGALPGKDKRTAAERAEAEALEKTLADAQTEAAKITDRLRAQGLLN